MEKGKTSPEAYQAAWERMVPYAERFSLPFSQMRTQQRGGALKSSSAGGSTEFYDHRQYFPGDDIRHINWAATARSEMITLKQFQQESSPTVKVFLDGSDSMTYDPQKWARALDLLALCGLSVMKMEVRSHATVSKGEYHAPLSLTRPEENIWLSQIGEEKSQGFAPQKTTGMPALHVYITDLLYEVDPTEWVRAHCRREDLNLFLCPTCEAETQPEWVAQSQLIDPETDFKEDYKVDDAFWKSYHEAYARHFSLWRNALGSVNGLLSTVPAEPSFYEAALHEAVPTGGLIIS